MNPLHPDQIKEYQERIPETIEAEPMSRHTTFHIGGPARLYVVAKTSDACIDAVQAAEVLHIPWYIYGGGSNLLVADKGYEGVVIQLASSGIEATPMGMRVEAGVITALAARKAVAEGWAEFAWAVTVPGTIGGAVYGNAGCYGGEMTHVVSQVEAYDLLTHTRVQLDHMACGFVYRGSMFKERPHLILSAELVFASRKTPEEGKAEIERCLQKRKDTQPSGSSSCGSVFRNVDVHDEGEIEILRRHVDEIPPSRIVHRRLGAGWLIEQAGMMGERVGGMEVSMKHGNFFLNKGHATAEDVLTLISIVKMKVRDRFGIQLQEEVQELGF